MTEAKPGVDIKILSALFEEFDGGHRTDEDLRRELEVLGVDVEAAKERFYINASEMARAEFALAHLSDAARYATEALSAAQQAAADAEGAVASLCRISRAADASSAAQRAADAAEAAVSQLTQSESAVNSCVRRIKSMQDASCHGPETQDPPDGDCDGFGLVTGCPELDDCAFPEGATDD